MENSQDIELQYQELLSLEERINGKAEASCPVATKNIEVNLNNRKKAIDAAMYGPLNPSEENKEYWGKLAGEWDVTEEEAKKQLCGNCALFIVSPSMKKCISDGLTDDKNEWDSIDAAGEFGYCEAFDFKCASKRTCRAWVTGGPITEDKREEKSLELKSLPKYDEYYSVKPVFVHEKVAIIDVKAAKQKLKDPKGGLTAAGRRYFKRTQGANLKPGVKGAADTPEKMRRKGSFLTRFFTNPSGPMQDDKGRPTRLALSAAAWGEPVPKNMQDAAKLAAKGRRLLERYEKSKKNGKKSLEPQSEKKMPFWEQEAPKGKPSKLTPKQKKMARDRAKRAGRNYPNLIDNAWAARQK